MNSSSPTDVKQKIAAIADPSTSTETKKSHVEFLLNSCIANKDFPPIVMENKGVSVLTAIFKSTTDFDLKAKATTLLVYLTVSGHSGAAIESLMKDLNLSCLVSLFSVKSFDVFLQVFDGLKILGDNSSWGSPSKSSISFTLTTATVFLENISGLIDPSSNVLEEFQKVEILGKFTRFVATGVMSQAVAEAGKDANAPLSKAFTVAYGKFVKTLESCHKNDLSLLDLISAQILLLVKEGKLISGVPVLEGSLDVINSWFGGSKKFTLLYKASNDGFTASSFHAKCDNQGPTVTLITCTEGNVFGGYAAVSFNSSGRYVADSSNQSFLFSLKNPRNAPPAKFGLKNNQYALYCHSSYGPTFSGGTDIYCSDKSNTTNSCSSNLGAQAYTNSTGLNGDAVFTGKGSFTAKEIEVYQVQ